MRLDRILNAVIPGMYDTPCKIAIFTNGRKIKVSAAWISIRPFHKTG